MRIGLDKSAVMEVSRKPGKYDIRPGGVAFRKAEKFKYLGVWFASNGGTDEDLVADRPRWVEARQRSSASTAQYTSLSPHCDHEL